MKDARGKLIALSFAAMLAGLFIETDWAHILFLLSLLFLVIFTTLPLSKKSPSRIEPSDMEKDQ